MIAVVSGLTGFLVAWYADVPTTPMMAFVDGFVFCAVMVVEVFYRKAIRADARAVPRRKARK
ncbi:hypothetical protein [Trueperella pyogenes]|uniref:hypothetical protein n=1 Tax=Trueperella pyogenes TaxID=1661 RepID=UPI003DA8FC47